MNSELSEEFEVSVWMHQGHVLSPFLYAVVVDVVTKLVTDGVYGNDLVLMSETFKKFVKKMGGGF